MSHDLSNWNGSGKPACIIQIIPALNAGGAERGCVDIAKAIAAAGGRSIVVSEGGRMVGRLEDAGSEHITMPVASKNPVVMLRNTNRLAKLINESGAGLVHARSRAPAWSAIKAAKAENVPFITTFHGLYGGQNAAKLAYNRVMVEGEHVIAVSKYIAEHILENYGTDPEKITTIPRGINVVHFDPEKVSQIRKIQLVHSWGIEDNPRQIILMPGRMTRWKGQSDLIKVAKLLRETREDFLCILPGDDQGHVGYRQELQTAIEKNDLNAHVLIPGHLNDITAAYALSDVVVSASTEPEAFGRVPVEAQAMGRPVIAYGHGGALETVVDGMTGFLVPPGDVSALAAGLDTILDLKPEARKQIGAQGRLHVLENFRLADMCSATLNLYQRLLSPQSIVAE